MSSSPRYPTAMPARSANAARSCPAASGSASRLARALYREPAILVLDEATSAVDNETEAAIQRSLARIAHRFTTLIVAHRLSTVRNADSIHVLEAGRIVESGTHDQLLARDGAYAALWRLQTGEAMQS